MSNKYADAAAVVNLQIKRREELEAIKRRNQFRRGIVLFIAFVLGVQFCSRLDPSNGLVGALVSLGIGAAAFLIYTSDR